MHSGRLARTASQPNMVDMAAVCPYLTPLFSRAPHRHRSASSSCANRRASCELLVCGRPWREPAAVGPAVGGGARHVDVGHRLCSSCCANRRANCGLCDGAWDERAVRLLLATDSGGDGGGGSAAGRRRLGIVRSRGPPRPPPPPPPASSVSTCGGRTTRCAAGEPPPPCGGAAARTPPGPPAPRDAPAWWRAASRAAPAGDENENGDGSGCSAAHAGHRPHGAAALAPPPRATQRRTQCHPWRLAGGLRTSPPPPRFVCAPRAARAHPPAIREPQWVGVAASGGGAIVLYCVLGPATATPVAAALAPGGWRCTLQHTHTYRASQAELLETVGMAVRAAGLRDALRRPRGGRVVLRHRHAARAHPRDAGRASREAPMPAQPVLRCALPYHARKQTPPPVSASSSLDLQEASPVFRGHARAWCRLARRSCSSGRSSGLRCAYALVRARC